MFSLNQYPGITIALAAMLTFGLLFVTLRKKTNPFCWLYLIHTDIFYVFSHVFETLARIF